MNYLVYDIGGSSIKYALMTNEAVILEKGKIPRQETFEKMIEEMLAVHDIYKPVKGISISCPAAPSEKTGVISGYSALPYIHGPSFTEIFKKYTGHDIAMENDANCAALSEAYYGNAKEYKDLVYIVIGSGIGGAILSEGKVLKGANYHAGEFGYSIVNDKMQSWSEVGSTIALVRQVQELLGDYTVDGIQVFDIKNTDSRVNELVEKFYYINARGIFNIQYSVDPNIILIGGAISENKEAIDGIKRNLQMFLDKSSGIVVPKINVGKFKGDANLLGALANLIYIKGEKNEKL